MILNHQLISIRSQSLVDILQYHSRVEQVSEREREREGGRGGGGGKGGIERENMYIHIASTQKMGHQYR